MANSYTFGYFNDIFFPPLGKIQSEKQEIILLELKKVVFLPGVKNRLSFKKA